MKKIVGVKFSNDEKIYNFDTNKLTIEKGDYVIADTERGLMFGVAVINPYEVDDMDLGKHLPVIIRKADNKDVKTNEQNEKDANKALLDARKISDKLKLDMRIIDASFTFDKGQLLYHFLADTRVDFRELAKKLADIISSVEE